MVPARRSDISLTIRQTLASRTLDGKVRTFPVCDAGADGDDHRHQPDRSHGGDQRHGDEGHDDMEGHEPYLWYDDRRHGGNQRRGGERHDDHSDDSGSAGTASVLARTLGGAKAGNTRFTYVTSAPTITLYCLFRYSIGYPAT